MRFTLLCCIVVLAGCAAKAPAPPPAPVIEAPPPAPTPVRVVAETVTVRDAEQEREIARLRIQLLERSAQLADAERRVAEATTEVVRAMARLRTLATRAEAASSIAEAEVTLQQLRGRAGQQAPTEAAQAQALLRDGTKEFDAGNYGGAVYLATQSKRTATLGRGRLAEAGGGEARAGERAFAVPVLLTTTSRTNLRAGPGTNTGVMTTADAGTPLTAYAYTQDWFRVTLADGRTAWVHQSLVKGVAAGAP